MNTTTINIKIDKQLKDDASALAEEFGMSFGTMIKVLLRQTVRKKHLEIDTREEQFPPEQMTPHMEKIIEEFDIRRRANKLELSPKFTKAKDMKAWLNATARDDK